MLRPCAQPGCPALVQKGRCGTHAKQQDRQRGTAQERGYDARWRAARAVFLGEHPCCHVCLAEGRAVAATVVDHVIPHKGDPILFWDRANWAPLCKRHHDQKTATQDGGFGR